MLLNKRLTLGAFVSFFFCFFVQAAQTPTISQTELVELLSQSEKSVTATEPSFIVLDVRTATEFNNGHIKNAINISHNSVSENINLLEKYKNKKIVVHCRSGRRAIIAEKILQENGFLNVRHLEGDIIEWVNAELPLVIASDKQ